MVDLDNDQLIERIIEIVKQLLMTRGTLPFSIANDVAKYFAIVPALFIANSSFARLKNIL
jgi:K+-transporting ATPase ATPase B chain